MRVLAWVIIVAVCVVTMNIGCTKELYGKHTDLAYIHLAQFEPSLGGMASAVEIYYVASDGVTQTSLEMTDDRIQSLRTGRVTIEDDFFERLYKLANVPLPPSNRSDPGVAYDSSPSRTRLLLCLNDGTNAFWEGDTTQIPVSVVEAIDLIKSSIERSDLQPLSNPSRFLRVRQEMRGLGGLDRRYYIVERLRELMSDELVTITIKHPYRLIPVNEGENSPLLKLYEAGYPVNAIIDEVAYQINLLKLIKNQKEER